MGNSVFFRGKQQIPRQTANSAVRRENVHATNIAGPANHPLSYDSSCQF